MSGNLSRSSPAIITSASRFSEPRVAIVHYWLVAMRGGERVVERFLKLFPNADLYTHVYDATAMSDTIRARRVSTSFIDRLPASKRFYQYYLPFMPMALESFDLTGYDLVISSEAGPAKGVITHPDSMHLCYCHSPMRYLWDQFHQYRKEANGLARLAMPAIYSYMRQWDVTSSARVDRFVANSSFVKQRIRKFWRRDADVVHPPVETSLFTPSAEIDPYYLWVGQMVPYKRPDLAVDAFNANGLPLVMVGKGSMAAKLKARARPNITFIDRLDFDSLRQFYARARAFLMTAEEDFGITTVEAIASGRPVVAFGRGGSLDIVTPEQTGVFFDRQEPEALNEAIERMEQFLPHFDPRVAVERSRLFEPEKFDEGMMALFRPGDRGSQKWN